LAFVAKKSFILNQECRDLVIHKGLNNKVNLLVSSHLIRFADKFLFITSNPFGIKNAKIGIKNFLKLRGLELSEKTTKNIHFCLNSKLDFLG
jgi:hypothetical protein